VGTGVCGVGITVEASGDDFDFVSQMRADLEQDQCIDADHVFMAGFSMGAFFSHHVGCMRPDLARAIAPHSGGTHDFSNCVPGHRPAIIMHGNIDGIIPVGCDEPGALIPTGSTPSATLWIQKNGCSADSDDIPVLNGICHVYRNCPADGQVELCVFDAMDHCWAGGSTAGHDAIFACPDYESATQLQWQFFKKYAW
jgi:poly(3-hydroxybutyrate) depolymerase